MTMTYKIGCHPSHEFWTPIQLLTDVLNMKRDALFLYNFGPYLLLHGIGWTQQMYREFKEPSVDGMSSGMSVRGRILTIEGINDVIETNRIGEYDLLLVSVLVHGKI